MTAHELMVRANHYLIKGGELTPAQKANAARRLLAAQSDERTKQRFYKGVKSPDTHPVMYPAFFIPPYSGGQKLQTVIPMSPKTHILAANSYELEIIRLLRVWASDNNIVQDMAAKTLERLKTTCFGYRDCAVGECFHTALIVLRFLAAAAPEDTAWVHKLLAFFKRHMDEKLAVKGKGVHGNVLWYYWLCLSELPAELAGPEILRYQGRIMGQLGLSYAMNSDKDKTHRPVMLCAARNALSRLPEYADFKDRMPYLNQRDNRLYFNVSLNQIDT